MVVLKVLGVIVLALALLSLVRLGAAVEFDAGGLTVKVKAGPFRFTVFPRKSKAAQAGKGPRSAGKPEKQRTSRRGDTLAVVKEYLPLIAGAAGRLKRKIRIDRFYLDLIMAAPDPAAAAVSFGGANAVLGMLWPPVEENFNVKDWRLRTAIDFELQSPEVRLQAEAALTVGQMANLGICLAVGALKILWNHQKTGRAKVPARSTRKEAV